MAKTIDENFRDWFLENFGYGYGTGDRYFLIALKKFMDNCRQDNDSSSPFYKYDVMEKIFSPTEAWLLINALCACDIIEYGCSPRFAWLSEEGRALKKFLEKKSLEELIIMVTDFDENIIPCDSQSCNCGPNGYQENVKCKNPFWRWHH